MRPGSWPCETGLALWVWLVWSFHGLVVGGRVGASAELGPCV